MDKITIKIDGMSCGMCENHINDTIRRAFPVKKVSSSHNRGETVIITEAEIDRDELRAAIDKTGYRVLNIQIEPYEKKGLFNSHK